MRKIRVLACIFGLASSPAISQEPVKSNPATSAGPYALAVETAGTSKIIMYRGSSVFGAAVACPIRYKGQEIIELGRGKYAEWQVPPGRYILNNHTSSVEVTVDPGTTSYVRCSMKMGMLTARADLQIVDEQSFLEHSREFTPKQVAAIPPR